MRRYRFGLPAVLVAGGYLLALAVAAVMALTGGDIDLLSRLTFFTVPDERVPDELTGGLGSLLTRVLVGGLWAWALWQSLRGPVAGEPPAMGRDVRLARVALYAMTAIWPPYALAPDWPWWAVVVDSLIMMAVVVLFQPVLWRDGHHQDRLALSAGVVGSLSPAAVEVFGLLGWPGAEPVAMFGGLGSLIWTVLVLMAQWRDARWKRATVRYGIASLVVPFVLMPVELLVRADWDVREAAASALQMIWLARSAHDLADPHNDPAPPRPRPARPPALAVTAGIAACVAPLVPPVVNLTRGHPLWITPHLPVGEELTRLAGDLASTLWWGFEVFTGIGGLAVVVLIALRRRTPLTWRVAMGAFYLTAVAGLASGIVYHSDAWSAGTPPGGVTTEPAISPLWFTAACMVSAGLLRWFDTMRDASRPSVDAA